MVEKSLVTESFTERFVAVGGVSTRVLEVAGTGPTIVLLHGFTDSADTWRPVLAELARMGRRAIAVDLPGMGRADALRSPVLRHLDDFVEAVITELGAGRVVLAGNSLGGLLAMRAGSRTDLPIDAVVGIGPAGLGYGWRLEALSRVVPVLHPVLRLFDWVPFPPALLQGTAVWLHRRALVPSRVTTEHAVRYGGHFRSLRDVARMRSYLIALGRELPADPLAPEQIRVPVQLIWGARDRTTDLRSAPAFLAAAPQATLEVLERAGHCPQLQEPGRIAELIAAASAAGA